MSETEVDPPNPESDEIVGRHKGLVRRTALVSVLTLLSRILGFVREVIAAALFGDRSGVYDAFITAWRVPNLFRRFLGEGAISTSLQTTLTEVDGDEGNEAGRLLFLRTLGLLFWILLAVCATAIGVIALLPETFPGTEWQWLGPDADVVKELCLRLMPFVVLICLSALCAGALQVRGQFRAPAFAPVALNVVWIAGLVFLGAHYGWGPESADEALEEARKLEMTRVLAGWVLVAGAAQLLVNVPALFRSGLVLRTKDALVHGAVAASRSSGTVLKTALPLALGAAVYQINVMVDGIMAEGLLEDGGPSAHYYANRIQQFPLALIAIAATSAVFPSLKALGHRRRLGELRVLHDRTQLAVSFLALPASLGLAILARPVCAALFERGEYGPEGVARMSRALFMLALALLPAGAVGLVSRVYYAVGDFKYPVRVSVWMLVVNVALNVALVAILGMDADGLALATAVSSWGNLLALLPGLSKRLGLPPSALGAGGLSARLGVQLLAAALAAFAAFLAHRGAGALMGLDVARTASSGLALGAAAAIAVPTYFGLAALLRVPEWGEMRRRFRVRGLPGGPDLRRRK